MYVRANGIYSDSRATKEITTFLRAGYRVIVVGWDREGNSEEKCCQVFGEYLHQLCFRFYNQQVKDHVGFRNIDKLYKWLIHVKNVMRDNKSEIDMSNGIQIDDNFNCLKTNAGLKILYKSQKLILI